MKPTLAKKPKIPLTTIAPKQLNLTSARANPLKAADGSIYYVSDDGQTTGVSIKGLEKLCGLPQSGAMFGVKNKVMHDLTQPPSSRRTTPPVLEHVQGKVFVPDLLGADNAKIVTQEATIAIVTYYASVGNPEAVTSLAAFTSNGFDNWIKGIADHPSDDRRYDELAKKFEQLADVVQQMQGDVADYRNLSSNAKEVLPGLGRINESLTKPRSKILADPDLYTIEEWLVKTGRTMSDADLRNLRLKASQTYQTLKGCSPEKKKKPYTNIHSKVTYMISGGYGYRASEFQVLEEAYKAVMDGE